MIPKKIILFGAGEHGQKALKYYGAENIEFFVDNNNSKVGGSFAGKPVISFERLTEIAHDYRVVVSSSYHDEISQQLEASGINDFVIFSLNPKVCLDRLARYNLASDRYQHLAIYGGGPTSKELIFNILEGELGPKVKYIVAEHAAPYIGGRIGEFAVCSLEEVSANIDALIIATEKHHLAQRALLDKKYGHLFKVVNPFSRLRLFDTEEIVYNRYTGAAEHSEEEWIETNQNNGAIKLVDAYVEKVAPDVPLFEFVEVETVNRCNGSCKFCPVNRNDDPRHQQFMDFALYKKIVDQLATLNYSGFFAPFSNNEPLLDDRIVEFAKYAKEHLPAAHVYLYTNGTLFTMEKFKQIMLYLDEIVIDNYNRKLELIKPCQEINDYVEQHPDLRQKVTISIRNPDEILTSRGGDAPNRNRIVTYDNAKCALPFRQMVIRPNGKVSLCCNDPYGKYTLGDLTKQSLLDVWYGEEYMHIRKAIFGGRKNLESCRNCDTFLLL